VTGDAVYGSDSHLRGWLERREISYVLAVTSQYRVFYEGARRWVSEIGQMLPQEAWKRRSAGAGAKGERLYDWAGIPLGEAREARQRWLLFRHSISDPTEAAYYVVSGPEKTSLEEIVRVAGTRWAIEESFESAKGEVGLGHYEVRSWDGWYRHITLAMLAHAYLTVVRARAVSEANADKQKKKRRAPRKRKNSFR
jgi:SRSO17 transposase